MTIDIPSPRGFLIAPNGAKSSMRLVFVLIALTVLFILLASGATLVWMAIYHPAAFNQLAAGDGVLATIGAYIMREALKWKTEQSKHELPAAPADTAPALDPQPVGTPVAPVVPVAGVPVAEPVSEQAPAAPPADGAPEPVGTGIIRQDGSEMTATDLYGGDAEAGESLTLVSLLTPPIPQEAVDFILEQEGIDQPWEWPGEGSGISIGYGYDLGYEQHFQRDWANVIPTAAIAHLSDAIGLKNEHAEAVAHNFRGIRITSGQASRVFMARTLPQEMASMRRAMPGIDQAPAMTQGAILSLGYNRGWGMEDEPGEKSRLGMRQIRDAVAFKHYEEIPKYLEEMAPLWPPSNGVHGRRLAEAKLAEAGLPALV